jgi:hypothetical protein
MKNDFKKIFKNDKAVIGMIHLKGDSNEDVNARMKKEIGIYVNNGIDGIVLENYYGDYDQLIDAIKYIKTLDLDIAIGVNCLNVDAMGFFLAKEYDLDFLQVDSVVGHLKHRDEKSLEAFFKMYRSSCRAMLIGGVRFKYQPVLSLKTVEEDLKIGMTRCDAIAVTENATGQETSIEKIEKFRKELGDFPLVVAAGVNLDNVEKQMKYCDAVIVGSYFKDNYTDTGDVDESHVVAMMNKVKEIRLKESK